MKILNLKNEKEATIIKTAVAALKSGGLIVYPTETCYGLGADATNLQAVKKVLQFKGERKNKPILIAVADQKMAEDYVEINEIAENYYRNFLPGPVAVVSKSKNIAAPGIESPNNTIGIRIPDYPLALKIIKAFGNPITSTSANTTGKKTPYSLADVVKYTSQKKLALIDLFLDAGRLPLRPPSTVVDTTMNEPTILRQGEIVIPDISGQVFTSNSEEETKKIAVEIFYRYQNLSPARPLIFALQGELGSGKTQFAKGLGQALGIKANISSPTFNLIKEYPYLSGIFYHLDTWRLQKGEELLDLGLEKMLKPGNIIAIEWLQKIKPILQNFAKQKKVVVIWLTIETLSENKRRIKYNR
jgi:L-threonylcarbamoyladenylate synthase